MILFLYVSYYKYLFFSTVYNIYLVHHLFLFSLHVTALSHPIHKRNVIYTGNKSKCQNGMLESTKSNVDRDEKNVNKLSMTSYGLYGTVCLCYSKLDL